MKILFMLSALMVMIFPHLMMASNTEVPKAEHGVLEATIAVPDGLDIKDVRECIGRAYFSRRARNTEVSKGKIVGDFKGAGYFVRLRLTAIYSTSEIKLYGKVANPDSKPRGSSEKYPTRWVGKIEETIKANLSRRALTGE